MTGHNPKQSASRSPLSLFTFPEAVTETFDHGQIGVVHEAIQVVGTEMLDAISVVRHPSEI